MKHASIGILVLALVAALALPAAAQNAQAGETSPGSSQVSGQQPSPGAAQGRADSATSDQDHATTTATPSDSSIHPEHNQRSAKVESSITSLLKGGEEADRSQFQALDQHLQMLENSINQLRQLSNQPEQNAADILRWSDIRDQHAQGVADVVASYFLQQRLLPPSMPELGLTPASANDRAREQAGIAGARSDTPSSTSTAAGVSATSPGTAAPSLATGTTPAGQSDPMREAYLDQLQTAHELLVRAHLVKQTSDPAEVREIRSLVTKLRSNQQQYQRQIEAHLRDMESHGGTEQAARPDEQGNEPGIDQPGERQAARPGESGSTTATPNTSNAAPDTGGSAGNQSDSPGAAGGQDSTPGSATP